LSDAVGRRGRRLAGLLRPAHGWRDFATEVAIVIVGVLLALGAQQLVDSWRTESDVADFRAALNVELAQNLGSFEGRIAQSPCLVRRLDQLDAWQRAWRDGNGAGIEGTIGRPLAYSLNISVWRTGAAGIATHLPLKERLAYAGLYDDLDAYWALAGREVTTWQAVFAYDGAKRLTPGEVNTLRGLIVSARSIDRSMQLNWPDIRSRAAALGIHPKPDPAMMGQGSGLCEPLSFTR
jgi:hypothetical protein